MVDLKSMSKDNAECGKPVYVNPWQIYTDGSKLDLANNNACGAGMVPFNGGQPFEPAQAFHLGNNPTVFQCEIYALKRAAFWIIEHAEDIGRDGVSIFTDSQAALLALNSVAIRSKLVNETIRLFERVLTMTEVSSLTIHWIKAHVGHSGNCFADEAALRGAQTVELMVQDPPALPKAEIHRAIDKVTNAMWSNVWTQELVDSRQTRMWFPRGPRPKFSYSIMRLPRVACGQLVQFLTGHNFLKRHQAIIDKTEDNKCTFCGRGKESSEHIMSYCDAFATLRQLTFNDPYPAPPYDKLPFEQVVNFLK